MRALLYEGGNVNRRFSSYTHLAKPIKKPGTYDGDIVIPTRETSTAETHPVSDEHYIRHIAIIIYKTTHLPSIVAFAI